MKSQTLQSSYPTDFSDNLQYFIRNQYSSHVLFVYEWNVGNQVIIGAETLIYTINLPTTPTNLSYLRRFGKHFISNDAKIISLLAGTGVYTSNAFLIYAFNGNSYELKHTKSIAETIYETTSQVLIGNNQMLIGGVITTATCLFRI